MPTLNFKFSQSEIAESLMIHEINPFAGGLEFRQLSDIAVEIIRVRTVTFNTNSHLKHAHLWAAFATSLRQPSSPYLRIRFRTSSLTCPKIHPTYAPLFRRELV